MKWEENLSLQQLLDQAVELILKKDSQWMNEMADAFKKATEVLWEWNRTGHFELGREKGKEKQARVLGYLYNVVWMCWKKGCEVQWGLEQFFSGGGLWSNIESDKVTVSNIRMHFDIIEERLRVNAELY